MLPTLRELGEDTYLNSVNFCHAAALSFKIWFLPSTQKTVILLFASWELPCPLSKKCLHLLVSPS